jgi:anti-sigma factor RsiW
MSHAPRLFALEALVAGRLSAAGTARLERHLAACATCSAALQAVREYDGLRQAARDDAPPELAWERLEKALDREAKAPPAVTDGAFSVRRRQPESRNGRWVALAWPVLAVAAVLVIAWISKHGQDQVARRGPVAAVVPSPAAEVALIEGHVTLVMGRAERVREGERAPLVAGDVLREQDAILASEGAAVHVALADGSGFALAASSELSLERLRTDSVLLRLVRGDVASEVRKLAAPERYVVRGTTYSAHVRGTRFSVRQTAGFAVAVSEGLVEIMRDAESIAMLGAGQHWESSPDQAVAQAREPRVYGLGKPARDWPTLSLPVHPSLASWHLEPAWVAATAELAMRAPVGENRLELEDVKGKLHTVTVTVLPEGTRLSESALRKILEPADTLGFLPPEKISPVVQEGLGRLKRCYERTLRQDPRFQVKLVLAIRVAPDGHVARAQLASPAGTDQAPELPDALERCVLDEARTWQFPRPEGGAISFEVPLNLRARE